MINVPAAFPGRVFSCSGRSRTSMTSACLTPDFRLPCSFTCYEEESVLQRQTQTAAFWRDQFETTPEDVDFLYALLLDAQTPRTLAALTKALIGEYTRRESARLEQELAKGAIYQPKNSYAVGQRIVFPTLDFAMGKVASVRPGKNPEHGDFAVVKVEFDDGRSPREYAANLHTPHRLNQSNGADLLGGNDLLSADEIYNLYQAEIEESLAYALEEGERSSQFVQVGDSWLLADMLAEVHVGHLNISEAMIEVAGQPLSTEQLLAEMELDKNVSPAMRLLSLNHALDTDPRFEQVYSGGKPMWFLRRMEPDEIMSTPPLLRHTAQRYNRSLLSVELLQFEWELDDEWGESTLTSEVPSLVPNTSITLIWPHRRHGTLPVSGRTRAFFPTAPDGVSLVTLIDGRWGTRYHGWVSHQGRYVAGLSKWMDDHTIPAGAYITLERTNKPDEVIVDFRTRRAKREWARMAMPDVENGLLSFEMNKVQVACEYDEQLIVADADPTALDALREQFDTRETSLSAIVEQVVPELTKLNPQGSVHAKSVYAAVNMVRRAAPGPVFHALISSRKFRDVGSGFFALA